MIVRFAMSIGLLGLLLGGAVGQETVRSPGNPPHILIVYEIDKEASLVLVRYNPSFALPGKDVGASISHHRITEKIDLAGVKVHSAVGKEISLEAARKLLGKDTPVLASSWGQPLSPFYRKLLRDETLVFVFPKEAPAWKEIPPEQVPAPLKGKR